MKEFAMLPNSVMKISGLSMFTWRWEEETFLEWALAALEIFGAGRCMLGSNFPVDRLYVSYDELFGAWEQLAARCSPSEAASLAGGTAVAFYRL
jgi:predicted TIM-barrel fold metal-dependent hydrolase